MLPEEIKEIEEKEPLISKECYHLYSTTDKTLKEVAAVKNIEYNTIKHYSRTYKYRKRIEHYNITKPRKHGAATKKVTPPQKEANKKGKKKDKQAKQYTVYTYETTTTIRVALTDKEIQRLKTRSKKRYFVTMEDYLINLLEIHYSQVEANKVLGYPDRVEQLKKNKDHVKSYELTHPKLLTCNDNIQDTKQRVLEDYY